MMNGSMGFNSDHLENFETNHSPGKLEFRDLRHGNLLSDSFNEGPEFHVPVRI